MLRRYHIIALDDLRGTAEKASAYLGQSAQVIPIDTLPAAHARSRADFGVRG